MKELKDTIKGMESPDYKERLKAEYWQAKIRYEKLKAFCNRIEAALLAPVDRPRLNCPLEVLRKQQSQMGDYLHTLEIRAIIEGIDLGE